MLIFTIFLSTSYFVNLFNFGMQANDFKIYKGVSVASRHKPSFHFSVYFVY